MLEALVPMAVAMLAKFPITASVFMVIGVLRAIFKPIMSVIAAYIAATPSLADDKWFAGLQENSIYKGFAWFLDYAASIKLPGRM